jgi:3-deoxy-D-manno-octulosonic-acid transferase
MKISALDLYRFATVAAAPAAHGLLALRRMRGKEDAARVSERLGIAQLPRPEGKLVWLHAASVGEAQSSLALIDRLLGLNPKLAVLVTTGTVTSAQLMAERLPPRAFHQFVPVDRPAWVRRFLDHWRPDLALWIESELWPNLVLETASRQVPMVLINARMSDRSFASWQRWPTVIRPLLRCFRRVLAQSEADAARFRTLGARDAFATGSLKYDAAPLPADTAELDRIERAIGARVHWLAASTHPGEEAKIAEAHRALARRHPTLLTVLVPRHPARGGEIAAQLRALGFSVALRSRAEPIAPTTEIYLADTMGELGLFYRLASIVFVGGSLVPKGGQNPLEPARLGCAILYGPHMDNFRAIAGDLIEAGAAEEVRSAAGLADAVSTLLDDEGLRERRCAAARRTTDAGGGVIENVLAALARELSPLRAPRPAIVPRVVKPEPGAEGTGSTGGGVAHA